ncbi:MAG: endo alpha-1,4 polygalactosaminidase, partial [Elusimicrobiales bacterium]|nr:endo alpha-1,4 polygalactosaminidase [Elusimicrobiales bacterium]
MKFLCLINFIIFTKNINSQSIAFYYGNDFSSPYSQIFDLVVVQPENLPKEILSEEPERYYAYISISEFNDEKLKNFAITYRDDWNSFIADIRNPLWQDYLLQKIKKLKEQGFVNFFFDNIDSYKIIMKNQNEEKDFINAIIKFLDKFKTEHPESDLILNRPLDILNEAIKYSSKIVVESLFHGIVPKNKKYIKISKEETDYLLEILNKAKKIGYKVYVVDYEKDKKQRLNIARIIKEYGFE